MNTLAWKAADSETASGTDTSTPTLTATETQTETATGTMTATLAGTPTEEPPAPFESAYYTYDGDDNMVMSVINGVTTYYASSSYVVEVDGSDTTVRKTYSAGSTSLAVRTIVNGTENTLNWLLSDHLGSSSITTTADGTWNSEIRYSAFGETRYSSGITPTDYRYTGQLEQADVNLYYYNARYYDAALGRFIQADTIIPGAGDSKSYDRYAYVNNNPIVNTDPTGHSCSGPNCPTTIPVPTPGVGIQSNGELAIEPQLDSTPSPIDISISPTIAPIPEPFVWHVAPPDFDNLLPDGHPSPPEGTGLPDDEWEWVNVPGQGPGYRNNDDPEGAVWRPDKGSPATKKEGEDAHWHRRLPGEGGRGELFPPNPEWGRGTNDRDAPGVYNPNTGRYEPQGSISSNAISQTSEAVVFSGAGYLLYRFIKLILSPACGPFAPACAISP